MNEAVELTRNEEGATPGKEARHERRLVAIGLFGILASYALFASQFVRCVMNNLWGDATFSGWSSAVGHQVVTGRVLFRDLLLPLPPGSFVVLGAIERWLGDGGPRLLHENWVCACVYTLMTLLGYAIARPIVDARTALFTAAGTAGAVSIWLKELAYDPLAEIWAWSAVAVLSHAWVRPTGPSERRLMRIAGLLTGMALFFKQSTSTGMFWGTLAGIGSLALVERRGAGAWKARGKSVLAYATGTAVGALICLALVRASGGNLSLFLAAMFVDGPALKGGIDGLTARVLWSVLFQPMTGPSLAMLVIFAVIVVRVARHPLGFLLGAPAGSTPTEKAAPGALAPRHVAGVVALCAAIFGGAAALLALRARPVLAPFFLLTVASVLMMQFAACLTLAFVVQNWIVAPGAARSSPTPEVPRLEARVSTAEGRAFNALALTTLVLGTTVSMSMTVWNPIYEMNPILAVSLIPLFVTMDRIRVPGLRWMALALVVAMPLGFRIPRASIALHDVEGDSFFRGMRVNDDGVKIVRAAAFVRDLAGPNGKVLVLPEDPSFAALVGRPRPALCGGIVFPDQYPARCLKADLAHLQQDPPDVLVLRPAEGDKWMSWVRTWRTGSPTEELMTTFLRDQLGHYDRAATYPTLWNGGSATLEVWRLRAVAPKSESQKSPLP